MKGTDLSPQITVSLADRSGGQILQKRNPNKGRRPQSALTKPKKIDVVLKKPRAVNDIISLAQAIEAAMSANATTFPSPTPTMVKYSSDINALVAAQTVALTRAKGAVQTRDAKLAVVVTDMSQLRGYVEAVAEANPVNASAIANSAGMDLRKPTVRSKNDVNVKQAALSGSAIVTAKVGTLKRSSHEWQYSTDGGKTWLAATATLQAKTTITGLTPATTVLFRTRAITERPTMWTDPASLLVS